MKQIKIECSNAWCVCQWMANVALSLRSGIVDFLHSKNFCKLKKKNFFFLELDLYSKVHTPIFNFIFCSILNGTLSFIESFITILHHVMFFFITFTFLLNMVLFVTSQWRLLFKLIGLATSRYFFFLFIYEATWC